MTSRTFIGRYWKRISALAIVIGIIGLLAFAKVAGQTSWTYRVIEVDGGYGYEILRDQKVMIHQDCMPSVSGRQPFESKKRADQVAQVVLSKLKKGEGPTVSMEEIKKMPAHE